MKKAYIALEGCPGRRYGEEFQAEESADMLELLLTSKVREDTRAFPPGVKQQTRDERIGRAIAADPEIQRAEANEAG